MDLVDKAKEITSRKKSDFLAGSVEQIFVYHDKMRRDESGGVPVFIKPEPETKKVKSIN